MTPGWFAGPGFRDQFTSDEEEEMERRRAWEEENCDCEVMGGEGAERTCPVHGDPEVTGR